MNLKQINRPSSLEPGARSGLSSIRFHFEERIIGNAGETVGRNLDNEDDVSMSFHD